jgi:formylglycine-generating enzyme required for sulfatase activity
MMLGISIKYFCRSLFCALGLVILVAATPVSAQMSEVDFDLLSAKMAKALKEGDYEKALPLINQIKNSGRDYTPSLIYFEGLALENIGQLEAAEVTYRAYMERAGKSGAYYTKALNRIIEIEDKKEAAAKKAAEEAARKAKAAEEAKRTAAEAERRAIEAAKRAEAAKSQPGHKFRDCDFCPEVIVIGTGQFTMGKDYDTEPIVDNADPPHTVTINRPYATGLYEVTRGQFLRFVRETGYAPDIPCQILEEGIFSSEWVARPNWPNVGAHETDSHPVACIGKADAEAYVAWLTQKTGETYRLPTNAEWEYAARAGTTTLFSFGDDPDFQQICRYGNAAGWDGPCAQDGYLGLSAPVGRFRPNNWGLYDVHGNVLEWVADCFAPYEETPRDGSAYGTGDCGQWGVTRGGGFTDWPGAALSSTRGKWPPKWRLEINGFRIARDVK